MKPTLHRPDKRYEGSYGTQSDDGSEYMPSEAHEVGPKDGTRPGYYKDSRPQPKVRGPHGVSRDYFSEHNVGHSYDRIARGGPVPNESYGSSGSPSTKRVRGSDMHTDHRHEPIYSHEIGSGGSAGADRIRARTQRGAAHPTEAFDPGIASEPHRY
jgi:hypothetical protein